ncbi:MAG: N-6 DNA methylase [Gemmataceae bacterium]
MTLISKGEPLPADAVRFSSRWIESQESFDPNPSTPSCSSSWWTNSKEIARKKRKAASLKPSERLGMSPGTVKRIVGVLEHQYLFGIDEDLNGRMFEGVRRLPCVASDLGNISSPRSVVKLVAKLARPEATRGKVDKVLDGCCGTGGFLIEALADMRKQLYDNESLTQQERGKLLDEVANASIFGIDASRDPPLARIARINMYLHGDGGSRVYVADALRSPPEASPSDSVEIRENVGELRDFLGAGLRFNVVLTNPPFSMDYSLRIPDEKLVLENYDLRTHGGKARAKLRSSVMFIERYGQLLEPGGRLLTIIDESVLSGKAYAYVRDFIRQRFILRAVISLHGDAFQRAGARVKTSILYLTLKRSHDEEQTAAFVYESRYIGVDDVVAKTPPSVAEKARADAAEEMSHILRSFDDYLRGGRGPWLVPAGRLGDRLDAKYLLPWSVSELERAWEAAGATTATLDTLVDPVEDEPLKLDPGKQYTYLKVTYEGRAEPGERRLGREVTYPKVTEAKADDIVVSHIRAVDRAVCVVPKELAGLLISPEYTVLRLKEGCQADPMYLWNVLRSAAVVAELLTTSSGQARYRVDWSKLAGQKVPLLPIKQQRLIGNHHRAVLEHEKEIRERQEGARRAMASLELDGPTARDKLARAKPPR